MGTFLYTGGGHTFRDGSQVKHGETVENERDLAAQFPHHFKRVFPQSVTQTTATPETEKTPVQKAAEAGAADIAKPQQVVVPEGMVDVTADIPGATEAGVAVFKNKRGFWVYDGDTEPANEKPLRKGDLPAFIKELAEG